jgi:hypothetical protein
METPTTNPSPSDTPLAPQPHAPAYLPATPEAAPVCCEEGKEAMRSALAMFFGGTDMMIRGALAAARVMDTFPGAEDYAVALFKERGAQPALVRRIRLVGSGIIHPRLLLQRPNPTLESLSAAAQARIIDEGVEVLCSPSMEHRLLRWDPMTREQRDMVIDRAAGRIRTVHEQAAWKRNQQRFTLPPADQPDTPAHWWEGQTLHFREPRATITRRELKRLFDEK